MQSTYTDVPDGQIAAVVTHLQMFARPQPRPLPQVQAELVEHRTPTALHPTTSFPDFGCSSG